MTWVILFSGFLLCFLSGAVLRQARRLRSTYAGTLRVAGFRNLPMPSVQVGMLAGWGAVFLLGCGLVGWGLVK